MRFSLSLERALPPDIPHRSRLIEVADAHLQSIVTANEYMNLTRITDDDEAAIKHIYDCVAPWRHFRGAERILDAGTGAGFPGIPLSVVFPEAYWTLVESTGKKARFVEGIAEEIGLPNVTVVNDRAESVVLQRRYDLITARAVAPLPRLLEQFGKAVRGGSRMLLFKGPDVDGELRDSKLAGLRVEVVERYSLPADMGSRTLLQVSA